MSMASIIKTTPVTYTVVPEQIRLLIARDLDLEPSKVTVRFVCGHEGSADPRDQGFGAPVLKHVEVQVRP